MQNGGLLKDLTVARDGGVHREPVRRHPAVADVLARAGIADIADRKVGKCSGGEQQRLRFAMALLSDPALLLLDEPTTGMDVEGRRDFWAAIREDAERGRTVLFATHYLEEADAYADRIVLISRAGSWPTDGSRGQGAGRRANRPRDPPRRRPPAALGALPGVDGRRGPRRHRARARPRHRQVARHLLTETAARDLEIPPGASRRPSSP